MPTTPIQPLAPAKEGTLKTADMLRAAVVPQADRPMQIGIAIILDRMHPRFGRDPVIATIMAAAPNIGIDGLERVLELLERRMKTLSERGNAHKSAAVDDAVTTDGKGINFKKYAALSDDERDALIRRVGHVLTVEQLKLCAKTCPSGYDDAPNVAINALIDRCTSSTGSNDAKESLAALCEINAGLMYDKHRKHLAEKLQANGLSLLSR